MACQQQSAAAFPAHLAQRLIAGDPRGFLDAAGGGGWPGDTGLVDFDTTAMRALGWEPAMKAEDAIRDAASGIADRYRAGGRPLQTSIERRAATAAGAGSQ